MWHIDIQVAQATCIPSFSSLGMEGIIYIQAVVTGSTSEICSTPACTSLRRERKSSWWVCKETELGRGFDQTNRRGKIKGVFLLYIYCTPFLLYGPGPHSAHSSS